MSDYKGNKYLGCNKVEKELFHNPIQLKIQAKIIELPCPSFSIAAVIKTLSTFLKTLALKIKLGDPEPFQATIIIALTDIES